MESKHLDGYNFCTVRGKLAERFSTFARLYAESVAALGMESNVMVPAKYDELCREVAQAQEGAEGAGIALREHVDLHGCVPSRSALPRNNNGNDADPTQQQGMANERSQ